MEENHTKMCVICLTSDIENNITDSSCYSKFFIQVMCLKYFKEKLMLCMWCRAAIGRARAFFKFALESEKAKQNKSSIGVRPYTLNFIHNSHIDIPPLLIEYQDCKTENFTQEMEEIINPLLETQDNDEMSLKANRKTIKTTDVLNEESISSKDHEDHIFGNGISTKKRNKKTMKTTDIINDESISNIEHDNVENEFAAKKRNKKTMKSTDILNKESISNVEQELLENGILTKKIKKKDCSDFNELKFEVEYLNFEEQLKELELKKLKYKDFTFQCDECGMGFLTSDVFEEHKVRHSKLSGNYKCAICSLHYKSRDVLSQHSLAHRRRYRCSLCARVFTRWSHCVAHSYKCGAVVTPTACAHCAKLFSNEYSLKIHMKIHKTDKKYCCDQCDRKFASKQRLTVHKRSHSGIKPFSCSVCSRAFATRSNLSAHTAVHDPTSQYYCVECHTYYKTEKSLKRHYKESAKHADLKSDMYSCRECSKQFSTEKSMNHHISTRHGTEHRCSHCDKTFSNNSNLNKHIKCIHTAK